MILGVNENITKFGSQINDETQERLMTE